MIRHSTPPSSPSLVLLRVAAVALLATVVACGDGSDPLPPDPETVAAVNLDVDSLTLLVGEQAQLAATVTGSKGSTLATAPTWSSLDEAIATVSGSGQVSAVSAGDARIVASVEGRADTAEVRVRDSSDLPSELSGTYRPLSFAIAPGETYTATGPVLVHTDGTLRIDGTLRFAPGADVVLYSADSLVIGGSIEPLAPSAAPSGAPGLLASTDACGFEEPSHVYLSGATVYLTSGSGVRSDGHVYAAASVDDGIFIGTTSVSSGRGNPGCKGHPGATGYGIRIGTEDARVAVAAAAGAPARGFGFVQLTSDAVTAGTGGPGWSIPPGEAEKQGFTRVAHATDGGDGGDVVIASSGDLIVSGTYYPGIGGDGGRVDVAAETGQGADGAGEDLDARSGSGGRLGDVRLDAPRVETTGLTVLPRTLAVAGGITATGGHGGDGRPGGFFDIAVGSHGGRGVLAINGEESTLEGEVLSRTTVAVFDALTGGEGKSPESPGGDGGDLRVVFLDPLPFASRYNVVVEPDVGHGGPGFSGCASTPGLNGSNGGFGGRFDIPIEVRGDSIADVAFSGADGGDGVEPGLRGERGWDVTLDQPAGEPGLDGVPCGGHVRIEISTWVANLDPDGSCPARPSDPIRVTHAGAVAERMDIGTSVRFEGTGWTGTLSFQPSAFSLEPGESEEVEVTVGCPSPEAPVTGTIRFDVTWGGGSSIAELPFEIQPQEFAVVLGHTLSPAYPAGAVIPLRRIQGGFPFGPEAGCSQLHLHSESLSGILIDGNGPFVDPDDFGCGYGVITTVPVQGIDTGR